MEPEVNRDIVSLDMVKNVGCRDGTVSFTIRLREAAGDDGVIARLGGDEFAILLPPGSALSAEVVGGHLLTALVRPTLISGHTVSIGASVGVARWPDDGESVEALFEAADRALYAAKALARSGVAVEQRVVFDRRPQTKAA